MYLHSETGFFFTERGVSLQVFDWGMLERTGTGCHCAGGHVGGVMIGRPSHFSQRPAVPFFFLWFGEDRKSFHLVPWTKPPCRKPGLLGRPCDSWTDPDCAGAEILFIHILQFC